MRKRLLICAVLVAAGLVVYKPWAKERAVPRQAPTVVVRTQTGVPPMAAMALPAGEEESEPVEVIDLSHLPLQKYAPVPLPELPPEFLAALAVKPHAEEVPAGPMPVVPEFQPFAAVGEPARDYPAPTAWVKVIRLVWGLPEGATELADPLRYGPVSPLEPSHDYHRDHPECPFAGARPAVKVGGEETQDAPVKMRPGKWERK